MQKKLNYFSKELLTISSSSETLDFSFRDRLISSSNHYADLLSELNIALKNLNEIKNEIEVNNELRLVDDNIKRLTHSFKNLTAIIDKELTENSNFIESSHKSFIDIVESSSSLFSDLIKYKHRE